MARDKEHPRNSDSFFPPRKSNFSAVSETDTSFLGDHKVIDNAAVGEAKNALHLSANLTPANHGTTTCCAGRSGQQCVKYLVALEVINLCFVLFESALKVKGRDGVYGLKSLTWVRRKWLS